MKKRYLFLKSLDGTPGEKTGGSKYRSIGWEENMAVMYSCRLEPMEMTKTRNLRGRD
jgi:hypothetical protein